jgi:hypothetical protein
VYDLVSITHASLVRAGAAPTGYLAGESRHGQGRAGRTAHDVLGRRAEHQAVERIEVHSRQRVVPHQYQFHRVQQGQPAARMLGE